MNTYFLNEEYNLLTEKGFIINNVKKNILNIKRQSFNINIEIDDNYPFSPILIDNIKYNSTIINMLTKILLLDSFDINNINVLIYCHPKKITLTNKNHFQYNFFESKIFEIIENNKLNIKDLKIYTIDILNKESDFIIDGLNINNTFVNVYNNKFDLVFLPDCGGIWYNAQNDKKFDLIVDIINNCKNLLKINSYSRLYFSKIIYPELKQYIIDNIPNIKLENTKIFNYYELYYSLSNF